MRSPNRAMKTFHHGGRIGDCLFALWTMRALGGGRLVLTNYHKGNWDLNIARSMSRFLISQPYVEDIDITYYETRGAIDYDLQNAEDDYNPEVFGMTTTEQWPGRALIAQRYAHHFGLKFDGQPWLYSDEIPCDVAFHCPMRRSVRGVEDWVEIVKQLQYEGLNVAILGNEPPLHNQMQDKDWDLFDSAAYIEGAKCFLGVVSSMNALAEGLGKKRFVEHADDCWNVTPDVILNGMNNEEVVSRVWEECR